MLLREEGEVSSWTNFYFLLFQLCRNEIFWHAVTVNVRC